MWTHCKDSALYHVFTCIYSLLIEKDICDWWNVSVKLCVYVCLSSGDLFIFSVRVSSFFTYCCVICTLVLSFSCDNFFLILICIILTNNSHHKNRKIKRKLLLKKIKRSPDEKHESLNDAFKQSQMSFSIRG